MAAKHKETLYYAVATTAAVLLAICMVMTLGHFCMRRERLAAACEELHGDTVLLRKTYGGRTESDIVALENHIQQCRERFNEAIGSRQREELHMPMPRTPSKAEFYFDLQEESRRLEKLATENNVILMEGRRFGFVDTVREGRMDGDSIKHWLREMGEIRLILEALFTANDQDLRFQCLSRESTSPQELAKSPNDLFDARHVQSLRSALGSETSLYRLQFQCGTGTFRRFMNALEDQLLPVVPRQVHAVTQPSRQRADSYGRWLVVNPQLTDFIVFLEWVHLQPPTGGQPDLEEGGRP
jgi:hypothetical protein